MKAIAAVAAMAWLAFSNGARAAPQPNAPGYGAPVGISFTRIPAVPEPDAIPLYPQPMGSASTEVWDKIYFGFRVVRNVTRPTLTPVLPPPGKGAGAAVIVVPGGGFTMLQMDIEGWTIAHWLADHGIAAFVLKYRVRGTSPDEGIFTTELNREISQQNGSKPAPPDADQPFAYQDAIAVGLGVVEYEPEGRAAAEVQIVTDWILRRLEIINEP